MAARILISLLDETQEYARLQARRAAAAAAAAGVSADIVFAENNAVVQIHQLFARIHAPESERPCVIVVQSVTGEGLERVARNATAAGIGWMLLNRRVGYIEELRQIHRSLPIGLVTPDQVEIGRIHGLQVRALTHGQGLILYVQGPADTSSAQDRLRGIQETLSGEPYEWKILNGDWTEAGAAKSVGSWLRLKSSEARTPAILVAQNDAMAVGARFAGLAKGLDWHHLSVIGCDGLPEHGQVMVRGGDLTATVIVPASAGAAVEFAACWLKEGRMPPAAQVLAPEPYPDMHSLREPSPSQSIARSVRGA